MRGLGDFEVVETSPTTGLSHASLRALNGIDPLVDALKRRPSKTTSPVDVFQAEQIMATGRTELEVIQAMGAVVSPWAARMDAELNAFTSNVTEKN